MTEVSFCGGSGCFGRWIVWHYTLLRFLFSPNFIHQTSRNFPKFPSPEWAFNVPFRPKRGSLGIMGLLSLRNTSLKFSWASHAVSWTHAIIDLLRAKGHIMNFGKSGLGSPDLTHFPRNHTTAAEKGNCKLADGRAGGGWRALATPGCFASRKQSNMEGHPMLKKTISNWEPVWHHG